MCIATSIRSSILSQHALGDCTSQSDCFRVLLSVGYSSFECLNAFEDAVSRQQSAMKVKVMSEGT